MDKMTGSLLRYHRLRQHLSQEGLCKGICVVSYLCKIEQGKVDAGEDIIQALFQRLGIQYHRDGETLEMAKEQIRQFWECWETFEDTSPAYAWCVQQETMLQQSPLCLDYLLVKATHAFQAHHKKEYEEILCVLDDFQEYMEQTQRLHYHLLYCHHRDVALHLPHAIQALHTKICAIAYFQVGECYCENGNYIEALQHLQSAYTTACEEGNVALMMYASLLLGNCYSAHRVESLMMQYYTLSERIARALKNMQIQQDIAYNIGSTYLEWKEYPQALSRLLWADAMQANPKDQFLFAHKLALIYIETGRREEGLPYVTRMEMLYQQEDCVKLTIFQYMLQFIQLRYSKNYLDNPEYLKVLQHIYDQDKSLFGYRLFHASYLIEALKHHRRYKEALTVIQYMRP